VTPVKGDNDIKAMIKRHEGVRYKPYKDSVGLWTVGVGHLIGNGKSPGPYEGKTLSEQEVNDIFEKDYAFHKEAAKKAPGWSKANDTQKAALVDLTYNMGPSWHKKFKNTAKKMEEGDFHGASEELKNSKWYTQVGKRAVEITTMLASSGPTSKESETAATQPTASPVKSEKFAGDSRTTAPTAPPPSPAKDSGGGAAPKEETKVAAAAPAKTAAPVAQVAAAPSAAVAPAAAAPKADGGRIQTATTQVASAQTAAAQPAPQRVASSSGESQLKGTAPPRETGTGASQAPGASSRNDDNAFIRALAMDFAHPSSITSLIRV
jgi:lysozyme